MHSHHNHENHSMEKFPAMVRNELSKMSDQKREEFLEEYSRKEKAVEVAYLCWFFFGFHYAYMGQWGLQVLHWVTSGGAFVWWGIDLFRIPGMIKDQNRDIAVEILRNLKIMSS